MFKFTFLDSLRNRQIDFCCSFRNEREFIKIMIPKLDYEWPKAKKKKIELANYANETECHDLWQEIIQSRGGRARQALRKIRVAGEGIN